MDLNQITAPAIDLEESIAFYQKLGLNLIVHSPPRYARFETPKGTATFSLHTVDELPGKNGVVVYFEIEALDEKVKLLQAKGIQFDLLPTDQSWLWREARLKDPAQNQLILYFAGENRKYPPWRLNSESA